MGARSVVHCRDKQCCLYSIPILCQLEGMRKQQWESNPELPHGTAEPDSQRQPRQCKSSMGNQARLYALAQNGSGT